MSLAVLSRSWLPRRPPRCMPTNHNSERKGCPFRTSGSHNLQRGRGPSHNPHPSRRPQPRPAPAPPWPKDWRHRQRPESLWWGRTCHWHNISLPSNSGRATPHTCRHLPGGCRANSTQEQRTNLSGAAHSQTMQARFCWPLKRGAAGAKKQILCAS